MIRGWTGKNLREKLKGDLEYKLSELDKVPWGDLDEEEKALRNKIRFVLDTPDSKENGYVGDVNDVKDVEDTNAIGNTKNENNGLQTSHSQTNSKYSVNAYIADVTIDLIKAFFFICVGLLIYISTKIGGDYGWDIFIFGFILIILNFGLFAIFAEIYRHLKEINNKTKHPDSD
tara:strand:+ start:187 stop:708 length:522 start_codon:yes stop_codon:yes gene_type:complete